MEEQTLRFYLSLFSSLLITSIFIYIFLIDKPFSNNELEIKKGDTIRIVSNKIGIDKSVLIKKIYFYSFILSNKFYSKVQYGKFLIDQNSNFLNIVKTISKKSNVEYQLTIVEGWENYQLNSYLQNFYNKNANLSYDDLLANTYFINSSNSITNLKKYLNEHKTKILDNFKNHQLVKEYGIKNILIISSLVEKEAKNSEDSKLIASVIFNRLERNMKLQIDASVIYSLTEGKYKFNRNLTYKDLKIMHPFNTYFIKGLPPDMICYVSLNTIKIVLERAKSDFLFYFYNIIKQKHIFSKNFNEHKRKLNEYKKKL